MKKFAAILNKKIETGKIMNALAHMTAGLAGTFPNQEEMSFIDYKDQDGRSHIASKHPFIILKAKNSNQIRTIRNQAIENNIYFTSFTEAMTIGTWEDQLAKSKETKEENLEYYGICLFGDKDKIETLTKKFSLWI